MLEWLAECFITTGVGPSASFIWLFRDPHVIVSIRYLSENWGQGREEAWLVSVVLAWMSDKHMLWGMTLTDSSGLCFTTWFSSTWVISHLSETCLSEPIIVPSSSAIPSSFIKCGFELKLLYIVHSSVSSGAFAPMRKDPCLDSVLLLL